VAKVYYNMVLKNAAEGLRDRILERIEALDSSETPR
jgi:hypothetical protein